MIRPQPSPELTTPGNQIDPSVELQEWLMTQARIWIYAPYAATLDDASFCALVEHELYHLAQKRDREQQPMFDDEGRPVLTTRAHDVGEFLGVVERYGVEAVHPNVKKLVEVAKLRPKIQRASIQIACGTCAASA